MPVKLLYFAWVREKTGVSSETVDLPETVTTIDQLISWLKTRGPQFESAFENAPVIRAAINQAHVNHDAALSGASEIAFFPPVTGG